MPTRGGRDGLRAAQAAEEQTAAWRSVRAAQDRDSDAIVRWRQRMGSEPGKQIYKQRAASSETINAQQRRGGGLVQLTVRGIAKATCVALWSALAYNVVLFSDALRT